ncbi:uncharacterized protein CIMG_06213 [Coccidioides immitis RS]|uniref:AT DNA binding protein n=3 Tax=Coccidioides immitis TaxID=5501 RepID=J3K7N9_COCIM|nr:uncharacterized protein CIMG_06213 [Coccidioides immitis RS]EAS30734.3 hypothetical protein CIMG_06213 [Coccidioides immitis RS]KMP03309.1 hypothetical protein CIRG_03001 [Coccidioides immitis RMSCC 2394]TPX23642.1 hypothetical protein DIZ76_012976 [Coccidioides immitis]
MSSQPDKPWTEEEKNFLLTEILKKAGISSSFLFSIIKENQISPNWMEIPLPEGRSLHSCQTAFFRMEHEYTHAYRRSFPGPPAPAQTSPENRKRPLPPLGLDKTSSAHRAIQPKPTPPGETFQAAQARASLRIPRLPDPARGEPPRKRGRPSKAEIQRRTLMAQARGEQYPAPKRPVTKKGFGAASPTMRAGVEPDPSPAGLLQQSLPAQQQHRHGDASSFQGPRDEPTSQTEDIQVRRMTAPHGVMSAQVFGNPGSGVPAKESMPRTLEGQISSSPTTFSQSFRGIIQSRSGLPSPRHDSTLVSNVTEAEAGVDSAHSILDEQRET